MLTMQHPESITKTFVFQKQQTQQSTFVQSLISFQSTLIDISFLLILHCPPTQFHVCIYDPEANKFVALQKIQALNGLVPCHFLEPSIILIRFQKIDEKIQDQSQQSSSNSESKNKRDMRSRQRTIRQTIALVKRWRQLINTLKPGKSKKRMNLQQAAGEIGVSKKTLDDYYCQLRLAELHNFNFIENIDQKIGKLRNYVKENRTDQSIRILHQKYPKTLKVIEDFVVDREMQEYIMRQKQLGDNQRMKQESQFAQIASDNPFLNDFSSHKIFQNLEDDYYKGFEFLMDEQVIPSSATTQDWVKKIFQITAMTTYFSDNLSIFNIG